VQGDRLAEGVVSGALAQLRAMQGDFDEARVRYGEEMRLLADLGVNSQSASTSLDSARVEVLAGDLAAAESHLRRDDAQLAELGEHYFRSEVAGMLGRVLMLRGDEAEAEAFVVLAEALSDADDAGSQVLWRSARARLLATSNPQRALELARGAVDVAETTADLLLRGDAWSDLGEVHLDASGVDDAMGALEHALELYELKGDTTSTDRARRRIAELRAPG
jgi:tetratricopeptide (TPR) repeat protein